jgi:hypothetical protein
VLYSVGFGFFLFKLNFWQNIGLTKKQLWGLLIFKILIGLAATYTFINFEQALSDIEGNQALSLEETHNLLYKPKVFLLDNLLGNYGSHFGDLFGGNRSYFNDLRNAIIPKFMGVLNVISGSNIYVNSIFFIFIGFIASMLWYKILQKLFEPPKWFLIAVLFLVPSVASYTSVIGKDVFIFLGLGLLFYAFCFFELQHKKLYWYAILGFLCALMFRSFIAVALLPFVGFYIISKFTTLNIKWGYAMLLIIVVGLIFISGYMPNFANIYNSALNKQQEFINTGKASTDFNYAVLTENPLSLLQAIPNATYNSFIAPYSGDFNPYLIPLVPDSILLLILLAAALFYRNKVALHPIAYMLFFSFLFVLLFTGFTITNFGALARYRSIYLPVLYCFLEAHSTLFRHFNIFTKK